ncbi:hypothetical protein HX99_03270 [Peptococcaceae bacterium SCADC1_2_3]|jgi:YgiT-type zinc finger domain-containing protein|nr:hypothetical protein DK28_0207590 [Peptococcaceae bacterium SCADC1_2_3]KFI36574.1 hypothetical protein HX99_03270 [Peptococcaceae bacterium SCADC1_2_3]KFI37720.1 hypothetical protein HY02_04110 [Peptococcaceae bacterium SCADC1_2_3]HCJ79274.1 YgiT-type zinc finger domain-containing protein [Desulfotomaculum sp.]
MPVACICGGKTKEKKVTVERRLRGGNVLFKGVPAFVCQECGERYFTAKTVKRMDYLLSQKKEEKEINFSVDPKEQYFEDILKLMNQQNIMPDGVALNQPVSLSEVFLTINRIKSITDKIA